jgi:hypothetical protein
MPILPLLCALVAFLPAAAFATGMGPPLSVPAQPDAPPTLPVIGSPPVLTLRLPLPPAPQVAVLPTPTGTPIDLGEPPFDPPAGLPDLTGVVDLPPSADRVFDLAPPFGADFPSPAAASGRVVPEPTTGLLVMAGLIGLALNGRRRRS